MMEAIDKINLIKDCIPGVVDEDDDNYGLFFLCWYGLLSKYGDEHAELIEHLFYNCEFFVENKPMDVLLAEAGCPQETYHGETGNSFSGVYAGIDSQLNIIVYKEVPQVCVSTINNSHNEHLVVFTHEVNHIFKSRIKSVIREPEKNSLTIRRGLFLEKYDIDARELKPECYHFILDEAVNVFQTADIMQSVCELDRELLPDEVKVFYDKLNLSTLSIPSGYQSVVARFGPLWDNENFRNSVDYNVVTGDIEKIEEDFDGIMGQGEFLEFSKALDYLVSSSNKGIKKIANDIIINNVINNYNRKTSKKGIEKVKS